MNAPQVRRSLRAAISFCAALAALNLAIVGAMIISTSAVAAQRARSWRHRGFRRELRVPRAAGRPLDLSVCAELRASVHDDNAPGRFAPLPPAATHSSEIQYIFDEPNTPLPGTFTADQQTLAATMRAAWADFAANGDPSTPSLAWPSFNQGEQVMSLVPPDPQVWTGFSDAHHCAFWAAGATTASH